MVNAVTGDYVMSWIMIIKNWKESLISVLFAIGAVLYGMLKYKSNKLEEVEHELKIKDKKTEIKESQDEFEAKVMADETIALLKEVDLNAKKTRDERNANL